MKVAVASGKGGTGKTLVSTNMAYVASRSSDVVLYDLDVDEPNCHLFLGPHHEPDELVRAMIPVVDEQQCTHCGECSTHCEFHAIISLPSSVLVFPELCHSCYGCVEACPEGAIHEGFHVIGRTGVSRHGPLTLVSGELEIGQPATTAMVKATKSRTVGNGGLRIYDSPPGTSCPVIEAVKGADYVLLVTEPTPFGAHDLDLMIQTMRRLNKAFGVVINKALNGNHLIEQCCSEQGAEVLLRIPLSMEIAREHSMGRLVAETIPETRDGFSALLDAVQQRAAQAVV